MRQLRVSTVGLTICVGVANPIPERVPDCEIKKVLMPTTSPRASTRGSAGVSRFDSCIGLDELPGLAAIAAIAAILLRSSRVAQGLSGGFGSWLKLIDWRV